MTDYTPVPGDSVKLVGKANPENVLHGVIDAVFSHWWDFTIDKTDESIAPNKGDWTITPWARPVTFKPFAVVRLPEGWRSHLPHSVDGDENAEEIVLIRANMGLWTFHGCEYQLIDDQVATLINHGAEVIFEGIDI